MEKEDNAAFLLKIENMTNMTKKQKTVKTAGFANLVAPSHGRVTKTVNNKGATTLTIRPLSPKSKLK